MKVHSRSFTLTKPPPPKKRPKRERRSRLERHLGGLPNCANQLGIAVRERPWLKTMHSVT